MWLVFRWSPKCCKRCNVAKRNFDVCKPVSGKNNFLYSPRCSKAPPTENSQGAGIPDFPSGRATWFTASEMRLRSKKTGLPLPENSEGSGTCDFFQPRADRGSVLLPPRLILTCKNACQTLRNLFKTVQNRDFDLEIYPWYNKSHVSRERTGSRVYLGGCLVWTVH